MTLGRFSGGKITLDYSLKSKPLKEDSMLSKARDLLDWP